MQQDDNLTGLVMLKLGKALKDESEEGCELCLSKIQEMIEENIRGEKNYKIPSELHDLRRQAQGFSAERSVFKLKKAATAENPDKALLDDYLRKAHGHVAKLAALGIVKYNLWEEVKKVEKKERG